MIHLRKIFAFSALASLLVIGFACTKPEHEEKKAPQIEAQTSVKISDEEQEFSVEYEIKNPAEGVSLEAFTKADWLNVVAVEPGVVKLKAACNESELARTTEVLLSYEGAANVKIDVLQSAKAVAPKTLTFEITIKKITSRTVTLDCIPSDLEATYVGMASDKSDFDEYKSDADLIASNLEYFKSWGDSFDDDGEKDPNKPSWTKFLRKGAMLDYEIQLTRPEHDYVFYAYGLNADESMTSPHVFHVEFKTTAPEPQQCTFTFKYRPGIDFGRINVYPSDLQVSYIWGVCPKAEYDAIEGDKAKAIIENLKEIMATQGGTWRDYVGYHNRYMNYSNLVDGEQYVAYAFGADISGAATTEAMSYEFTAKTVKKQDCDFSFSFQDVRATTFAAQITPSSNVKWVAYTLPAETAEKYNSVDEMTEVVIDTFNEMLDDGWWNGDAMVHTGAQLLSSYQLQAAYALDSSTKQIVCAFGIDDNGYRVTPVSQSFVTTTELGKPSDMTIDFEVTSKNGAVEIEYKPSNMEAYFYDLITYEDYSQFETEDAFYAEMMYRYSSSIQYKMTMGPAKMTTESLHAGERYVAYAFGIDGDRSTKIFTKVFTCPE